MKRAFLVMITVCFVILTASSYASAVLLTPDSVSYTGTINNIAYAYDNSYPNEWSNWTINTAYWTGLPPTITFDYGNVFEIQEVTLSVDNNDSYRIQYSSDNSIWNTLFNISSGYGDVGSGMDTMSTDSAHVEYIAALDFSPVSAQYLRIFAVGGDGSYSVGEFQAFGTGLSAVPEPSTMLLLGVGLIGIAGATRRKLKR